MNKLAFILLVALISSSDIIHAQNRTSASDEETQRIEHTIQQYFDGWMTGDTLLLGKAMHQTCHLKFVRDDKVTVINRNDYLSRFRPKSRDATTSARIIQLDITRTAASAKCEIERSDRLFTDYFNLLKLGDRWYIVDKISTSVSKD